MLFQLISVEVPVLHHPPTLETELALHTEPFLGLFRFRFAILASTGALGMPMSVCLAQTCLGFPKLTRACFRARLSETCTHQKAFSSAARCSILLLFWWRIRVYLILN